MLVVLVVVLVDVVFVLVGGIPQMVSLGSLTHLLVLRLQHNTPGQSVIERNKTVICTEGNGAIYDAILYHHQSCRRRASPWEPQKR